MMELNEHIAYLESKLREIKVELKEHEVNKNRGTESTELTGSPKERTSRPQPSAAAQKKTESCTKGANTNSTNRTCRNCDAKKEPGIVWVGRKISPSSYEMKIALTKIVAQDEELNEFFDLNMKSHALDPIEGLFHPAVVDKFDFKSNPSAKKCSIMYSKLIYSTLDKMNDMRYPGYAHFKIELNDTVSSQLDKAFKRPDLAMTDKHGRVLLKGEERAELKDLQEAIDRLSVYSPDDDQQLYAEIHSTIGYAAANSVLQVYFIEHEKDRPPTMSLVSKYELSNVKDRVKLVTNMICLFVVCSQQSNSIEPKQAADKQSTSPKP